MSDPRQEHVEALAAVFSDDRDVCGVTAWTNRYVGERIAKALLSSTDPAVHAAMLDALTRHGVLTRQVSGQTFGGGFSMHYRTASEPITSDEALAMLRERLTGEVPS